MENGKWKIARRGQESSICHFPFLDYSLAPARFPRSLPPQLMKKVIPGVLALVVLIAIAAAFFVWKKVAGPHTRATELAPAETIFFAHLPDIKRTAFRWSQTGLAKIGEEAEVQEFLAKPRANLPQMRAWDEKLAKIARLVPGEAFVAVTSIDGPTPRFLAGFSYLGRQADAEALLAEPRAELKRAWPAGKSDVTMQGKTQIETFTYQDTTVGEAFCDDWYFISNDLELLRRTIDAVPQGLGANALAANALFQKSTARLPADGEAVIYAQVGVLSERLVSLLVASGQALDPKQVADLKKMQAVAWGTKFEGAQMRDTLFLLSPGNAAEPPLPRSTLAFSSPSTFLTYAAAVPATIEVPESSLALGAFLPGFAAMQKGLSDKGLKWGDFGKAFGPEFGVVANWVENSGQPSALLALDVRDAATAKGFIEVFTGGLPGSPAWGRKEESGVTIYQSTAAPGLITVTPSAALTEKFLVIGFSPAEIAAALEQLKTGQPMIAGTPAYGETVKAVGAPTAGFGYLDLKTFFERTYGMLRPFIAMSLAFSPDSGKYIDAGKLPNTETISKHLTPSVYSQSVTSEGTLIESVGTLTFNQVFVGVLGGAVAAAFPMIESAFAGGLNFDPSTFQLTSPGGTPPAPSAPPKNEPQYAEPPPASAVESPAEAAPTEPQL